MARVNGVKWVDIFKEKVSVKFDEAHVNVVIISPYLASGSQGQ